MTEVNNYEIRSAIRRLFLDRWRPAEVEGLTAGDTDADDVAITLGGTPDDELPYPQVTIRGVSSEGGPRGLGPSGIVFQYDNRIDVNIYPGSYKSHIAPPESPDGYYNPERVGSKMGTLLRSIAHENYLGVPDPDNPDRTLSMNLEPASFPFMRLDPDRVNPQFYLSTLELMYSVRRNQ